MTTRQVTPCYPRELASFPSQLVGLLEQFHLVMDPGLRKVRNGGWIGEGGAAAAAAAVARPVSWVSVGPVGLRDFLLCRGRGTRDRDPSLPPM